MEQLYLLYFMILEQEQTQYCLITIWQMFHYELRTRGLSWMQYQLLIRTFPVLIRQYNLFCSCLFQQRNQIQIFLHSIFRDICVQIQILRITVIFNRIHTQNITPKNKSLFFSPIFQFLCNMDAENSNNIQTPYDNKEGNDEEEDELDLDAMTLILVLGRLSSDEVQSIQFVDVLSKGMFLSIYLTLIRLVTSFVFDWFGYLVCLQWVFVASLSSMVWCRRDWGVVKVCLVVEYGEGID